MVQEKAVLAQVKGRVQGVGFRAWTKRQAERLGLRGWVRNEPDGSVTALLAGPWRDVDAMLARLSDGPLGAHVRDVEIADADPADAPPSFRVAF
jgi:acylphosphatase